MRRDRDPGVKRGGIAGLRRKKGGKAGFEIPYCGPSLLVNTKNNSNFFFFFFRFAKMECAVEMRTVQSVQRSKESL